MRASGTKGLKILSYAPEEMISFPLMGSAKTGPNGRLVFGENQPVQNPVRPESDSDFEFSGN
jgi:hypothetical protein